MQLFEEELLVSAAQADNESFVKLYDLYYHAIFGYKPEVGSETHRIQLKISLLSARRSAAIGWLLVIIPVLFLGSIFLKYLLRWNSPGFTSIENWMSAQNQHPLFKMLIPLCLIGGPLVALAINLLAVSFVEWRKESREIMISVRMSARNIVLIFLSLFILCAFLVYVVGEKT